MKETKREQWGRYADSVNERARERTEAAISRMVVPLYPMVINPLFRVRCYLAEKRAILANDRARGI